MEINLDQNEKELIKALLKKEYNDFKEDQEDTNLTHPHVTQLGLEENYKDFLQNLMKKF